MDAALSTWLSTSKERDFILIIADRISGIHNEKGKHIPVAYHIHGSNVEIDFDGSERLVINDATDMEVLSDGDLVVGNASEVRFSWVSKKQPDGTVLPSEEVFRISGRFFDFRRTDAPFNTQASLVFMGRYLVRIRPVKTGEAKD